MSVVAMPRLLPLFVDRTLVPLDLAGLPTVLQVIGCKSRLGASAVSNGATQLEYICLSVVIDVAVSKLKAAASSPYWSEVGRELIHDRMGSSKGDRHLFGELA
jgi:hypothetical protein